MANEDVIAQLRAELATLRADSDARIAELERQRAADADRIARLEAGSGQPRPLAEAPPATRTCALVPPGPAAGRRRRGRRCRRRVAAEPPRPPPPPARCSSAPATTPARPRPSSLVQHRGGTLLADNTSSGPGLRATSDTGAAVYGNSRGSHGVYGYARDWFGVYGQAVGTGSVVVGTRSPGPAPTAAPAAARECTLRRPPALPSGWTTETSRPDRPWVARMRWVSWSRRRRLVVGVRARWFSGPLAAAGVRGLRWRLRSDQADPRLRLALPATLGRSAAGSRHATQHQRRRCPRPRHRRGHDGQPGPGEHHGCRHQPDRHRIERSGMGGVGPGGRSTSRPRPSISRPTSPSPTAWSRRSTRAPAACGPGPTRRPSR